MTTYSPSPRLFKFPPIPLLNEASRFIDEENGTGIHMSLFCYRDIFVDQKETFGQDDNIFRGICESLNAKWHLWKVINIFDYQEVAGCVWQVFEIMFT